MAARQVATAALVAMSFVLCFCLCGSSGSPRKLLLLHADVGYDPSPPPGPSKLAGSVHGSQLTVLNDEEFHIDYKGPHRGPSPGGHSKPGYCKKLLNDELKTKIPQEAGNT